MISKAQQEKAIGEGLALGFISLGIPSISSASQTLDHGFAHAWRNWPHAREFPQIRGSIPQIGIQRILHMSATRNSMAVWDVSGVRYVPSVRLPNWTVQMVADDLFAETGVRLSAWESLARDFTAYDGDAPASDD
jgi:hypothetical protein